MVAGGHAAFNPEPIADFIDAAVLGDGEQAVLEITDIVRAWKAEGRPGGRDELLLRLAQTGGVYVPRFYDVDYLPDGRIQRVVPNNRGVPFRVTKHTVMDLDEWPYPKQPLVPLAETGARADERGDLPRLHPRLPVLPGRHDHPAGARALDHRHRRDGRRGLQATGFEEVGLLSLSSADHSEIAEIAKGLADRYEGTNTSLSLPSHPGGRLQHRPGQRAVPQRPALRPDLRTRGRQRADAQGHQQDGDRGRPDPHGHHGVRRRAGAR